MSQFDVMNRHATAAASLLKALAHPERLMVLCQLVEGKESVSCWPTANSASLPSLSNFQY